MRKASETLGGGETSRDLMRLSRITRNAPTRQGSRFAHSFPNDHAGYLDRITVGIP